MTFKFAALLAVVCFFNSDIWGQSIIRLKNPSFEADEPQSGKEPSFWINLGDEKASPPDVQPGFFGVAMVAQDGKTYLGLVVREDTTWEGVGQKLEGVLRKDSAYKFSLWMTRSNTFKSALKNGIELANFSAPTVLKIWGYNTQTNQQELLAESQPVGHSKWTRYEFILKPSLADLDELDLMAYYAPGYEKKNGNLLIDNCSDIVKIY
ncbi:MAG: hypothetical protein ACKVT2_03255 [Saprospiraceae bacterium]